ncbi:elongation factor P maturation arginine rhamnosyltransferase EarP [Ideonella sp.]|uniref:elongation factor P maturation arginine rhamnosyltransferase EarP n=1 Tax=Ideonella sp. TaxID=1929293 RepID=UPI0035B3FAC5
MSHAPSQALSAAPSPVPADAWLWDVFCRVIDNHGDLGVCWRLAAELGRRGHRVRLWIDEPGALAWMAPQGAPGVAVVPWTPATPSPPPGDVVVEAFGCDPPGDFVAAMAARAAAGRPPVWVNLEYLSAEGYVERSHALPSPQASGPGAGLVKWFFYPGFTARTGGLLREAALVADQARFDAPAWRATHGIAPAPGERVVSLFCYGHAPLAPCLARLAGRPTLVLTAPGPATALAAATHWPAGVRHQALPWLSQPEYDHLLWSCDLNLVRGEDSFVRAQWAGRPFLWHIYAQDDGAHATKLQAFVDRHVAGAAPGVAAGVRAAFLAWNGLGPWPAALPDAAAWSDLAGRWREQLLAQGELLSQLIAFVDQKR